MNLPKTEYPLLDYADQTGVSQSVLLDFIEKGGGEFVERVFTEYIYEELSKKETFDNLTPMGSVSLCRIKLGDVFLHFQGQFEDKNKD